MKMNVQETHFNLNAFAQRLVFTQREIVTRKWNIGVD